MKLFSRRRWSSYLLNCQTNLVIALYKLSQLFCKFIYTTAYHLGRYKPLPPSTKELHGLPSCLPKVRYLIMAYRIFVTKERRFRHDHILENSISVRKRGKDNSNDHWRLYCEDRDSNLVMMVKIVGLIYQPPCRNCQLKPEKSDFVSAVKNWSMGQVFLSIFKFGFVC